MFGGRTSREEFLATTRRSRNNRQTDSRKDDAARVIQVGIFVYSLIRLCGSAFAHSQLMANQRVKGKNSARPSSQDHLQWSKILAIVAENYSAYE